MISRVAESCFWLQRNVERADSMARLLRATRAFLLDVNLPELDRWRSVIVVSGEQERFPALHGRAAADDGETVQRYLAWDERCPVGIAQATHWARENARTIREVISLEMWEAINAFWNWLRRGQGKRLYERDRDAFYQRVKDAWALFQGESQNTMLHEEPFDFMRLGLLLERANQTARMLDVKFHLLGPTRGDAPESTLESAQWVALLRSCSAEDSFRRHHQGGFAGPEVAAFLLLSESFPRAVRHSLQRASNFLERIATSTGRRGPSADLLAELVASLEGQPIDVILERGLHEELTRVIDTAAAVGLAIHTEFFDPGFGQAS